MSGERQDGRRGRALAALEDVDSSTRLRAALHLGTYPDPDAVDVLVRRCGVEPDFFVRDMLTWALTRQRPDDVVPKLLAELQADAAQRRSQALHTLSKVGDPRGWDGITDLLLCDENDEVARSAWRAAVVLAPDGQRHDLACTLTGQLGRGGRDIQLSLSRALLGLGPIAEDLIATARNDADPKVRAHAIATEKLLRDPESDFVVAIQDADRVINIGQNLPEG